MTTPSNAGESAAPPQGSDGAASLNGAHDAAPPATDPRKDSLIEYPSRFPVKVMGVNAPGFVHAVTAIAREHDPSFDASTVELRDSKAGNYLGVTLTVNATSRAQLDALYAALSTHPMVKIVL